MSIYVLLINGSYDQHWTELLQEMLGPSATLHIEREENAIKLILLNNYDLIIIDAAAVADVPLLIAHIRDQKPSTRVIVATASPTWTRAREAFQAGAIDYISKTLDKKEILLKLQESLVKNPLI